MVQFIRISLFLPCIALFTGCVFDSAGIPAGDGRPSDRGNLDRPQQPEAGPDAADLGLDLWPEAGPPDATAWDPECRHDATRTYVCRSDATYGQSGYCSGGKWIRLRHCFKNAPCNASTGLCETSAACSACPGVPGSCTTVCTAFVDSIGSMENCCVGTSSNGSGGLGSNCSKHEDCKSGLCGSGGTCFVACDELPFDTCPGGYSCKSQTLTLGSRSYSASGCVAAAPDAGPDASPPDLMLLEGPRAE